MKRYFVASLCRNGVLGGGIVADDEGFTFRTNKLTVPPSVRHLSMCYRNIREITKGWMLCFPVVTVKMKDGEEHRFVLFRRQLFCTCLPSGASENPTEAAK